MLQENNNFTSVRSATGWNMETAWSHLSRGRVITVLGNSMMPLYRRGDLLIATDQGPISVGDQVVVESSTHGTLGGTLLHRDKKCIAVVLGGKSGCDILVDPDDIEFLGRIIWASRR